MNKFFWYKLTITSNIEIEIMRFLGDLELLDFCFWSLGGFWELLKD